MKVQINADKQVIAETESLGSIETDVKRLLQRFESDVTRVEVHLSDLNSGKRGVRDKRCVVEVRPAGKKPVSADFRAATAEQAARGAAAKMKRLLETAFGKSAHQTSRASLRAGKGVMQSAGRLDKLRHIEAMLSGLLDSTENRSPQIERHVRIAGAALAKARTLAESEQPEVPTLSKTNSRPIPSQKARTAGRAASVDGRTPKKKNTYRARRKSWPAR